MINTAGMAHNNSTGISASSRFPARENKWRGRAFPIGTRACVKNAPNARTLTFVNRKSLVNFSGRREADLFEGKRLLQFSLKWAASLERTTAPLIHSDRACCEKVCADAAITTLCERYAETLLPPD